MYWKNRQPELLESGADLHNGLAHFCLERKEAVYIGVCRRVETQEARSLNVALLNKYFQSFEDPSLSR